MSQTLNIYQIFENLKPDISQPTPTQGGGYQRKKNMTVAFSAWSQSLISSFHSPLFPRQHWSEWVSSQCWSVLVLQEGKSMGKTGRVGGHTGQSLGSEPSLSEALQLSLRVHTWNSL